MPEENDEQRRAGGQRLVDRLTAMDLTPYELRYVVVFLAHAAADSVEYALDSVQKTRDELAGRNLAPDPALGGSE